MSSEPSKELLTAEELADVLRFSPRTVNRWAEQGRIRAAIRVGRGRRFRLDDVLKDLAPPAYGEGDDSGTPDVHPHS